MPKRLNPRHQQMVRDKIQTSQLINRLQSHIDGDVELSPSQIDAAKFLIGMSLSKPAVEQIISGELEHKHRLIIHD